MDGDSADDAYEQIAHVFVDLISLAENDDGEDDGRFAEQLTTAARRAFELGGVTVSAPADVADSIEVAANKLVGGAAIALGALFTLAARITDYDHDALIIAWREQLDSVD